MVQLTTYELAVKVSPRKAARRLVRARARLAELEAGAEPRFSDDTPDARREEVAGLEAALTGQVRCVDCGDELTDPVSQERGIGPKCWAKRERGAA